MKRITYISALLLSLLIIYAGAGVSIMRYCCDRCETVKACCAMECHKCGKSHDDTHGHHKDCAKQQKGCTATIYKLDVMEQQSSVHTMSVPAISLFCELLSYLPAFTPKESLLEYYCYSPPPPVCARQMLALFGTYLI